MVGEKIPLFILAAILSIVTFIIQQRAGAMQNVENLSIGLRIANALVSYVRYIGMLFFPSYLAVLYPHPGDSLPMWQPIISFVILAGISAGVIYMAGRRKYLAVGWLWYLGTLVPVIGLVQSGVQAMADRYTYLPSIGIFIMLTGGATELAAKRRYRKIGIAVLVGIAITVLLFCTRMQLRYWQNSGALFEHAIKVTENNYAMHNNYGGFLCKQGRFDQAVEQFNETLRIRPHHSNAHYNLGLILAQKGDTEKAVKHLKMSLRFDPDSPYTLINLARTLATSKNPQFHNAPEAVRLAERACELTDYRNPEMLDILAKAYAEADRFAEAVKTAQRAVDLCISQGRTNLAKEISKRKQFYKSKQASRVN